MNAAPETDLKRAHHLILCAFGGSVIGVVEAITIPLSNPDSVYVVTAGWLVLGAAGGPLLWLVLRHKPRHATPLVLSGGVFGAGVAAVLSVGLGGAFVVPVLALGVAAAWARRRLPDAALPGYCVYCGYDLRGLDRPRCPECGRPFDSAQLHSGPLRPAPPETDSHPAGEARRETTG